MASETVARLAAVRKVLQAVPSAFELSDDTLAAAKSALLATGIESPTIRSALQLLDERSDSLRRQHAAAEEDRAHAVAELRAIASTASAMADSLSSERGLRMPSGIFLRPVPTPESEQQLVSRLGKRGYRGTQYLQALWFLQNHGSDNSCSIDEIIEFLHSTGVSVKRSSLRTSISSVFRSYDEIEKIHVGRQVVYRYSGPVETSNVRTAEA